MFEGLVHELDEQTVAKLREMWALDSWGAWHISDLEAFCSYANTLGKSMGEASSGEVNIFLAPLEGAKHDHARRTLQLFFEEARSEGRIARNPIDQVGRKLRPRKVPLMLSREDVASWLEYLRKCSYDENRSAWSLIEHARILMVHEIIYATGITIAQIIQLRRSDLCKSPPSIVIAAAEGDRRIPITRAAYRAIHHFEFLYIGYVGTVGKWLVPAPRTPSKPCRWEVIGKGVESVIAHAPPYLRARISTDGIRFAFAAHLKESGISTTDLAFISGLTYPANFEKKYPTLFA
jgi:site-specific recombinase XerD